MAKFLTTSSIAAEIESIIRRAQNHITIVTPYLKLSENFIIRLKDADSEGIKIIFIYGKEDLQEHQLKILRDLQNIDIYYCHNLHAKCYANEEELVISSMNLYEFSEKNNREMGILLNSYEDNEIYQDTLKEVRSIINGSELIEASTSGLKRDIESNIKSNNSTGDSRIVIVLDDNYNEGYSCHIPSLLFTLEKAYPSKNISHSDKIIEIEDFVTSGVKITIEAQTVNIVVDMDNEKFNEFTNFYKESKKQLFNYISIKGLRIYKRFSGLCIYPEHSFNIDYKRQSVEKAVHRYLHIIKSILKVSEDLEKNI